MEFVMAKVASNEAAVIAAMRRQSSSFLKRSRTKEAKVSGRILSPTIRGGVAAVKGLSLGLDKNSNPFLQIQFVCLMPPEDAGTRFNQAHFLNESEYSTLEENYDRLYSDLQLMGIDTSELELDEMKAAVQELVDAGKCITFNTRANKKSGETRVFIQGEAAQKASDFDYSEPTVEAEPEEEAPAPKPKRTKAAAPPVEEEEEAEEYVEEAGDDEEFDFVDDEEADGEEEAEPVKPRPTPRKAATAPPKAAKKKAAPPVEEEWAPAKGDQYNFKANAAAKPQVVVVLTVNKAEETVTIERESDGKKFAKVPWTKLEG
jgi:hypothetical protein